MSNIQQQLDIPRDLARELGLQAVEIITKGFYTTKVGKKNPINDFVVKSKANTITYSPEKTLPDSAIGKYSTEIEVLNTTTLAATKTLLDIGCNPVALNMASATSPGGGFLSGARAQEEYLCRSSALFDCLRNNPMYSRVDFQTNPFYDDYVIYSPDVIVFRDDNGDLLDEPYSCSIMTSPAVQASAVYRYLPHRSEEIEGVMWKRILKVLAVAHAHDHDALVLGAWGCGAFGNDGQVIAELFKKALVKNFLGCFKFVIFAITDWSPEKRFIGPFINIFNY